MATTLATVARNAACDAVTALVNGGKIRIKSAGAVVIAEITLAATAFGAAATGVATANSLPLTGAGIAAAGAGTAAATFDVCKADNTVVWSGAVGAELTLNNTSIADTQAVTINTFTHAQPA